LLAAVITSVIIISHVIFKNKNLSCGVCCVELSPFDESLESCAMEQVIFHELCLKSGLKEGRNSYLEKLNK